MPRVISFIVLLAIVLLAGAIFFQVMAQFFVPLFLASVLLVVFQPLHAWTLRKMPRHPRIAALATTILILLVVLLPLTWLGWNAYVELYALFHPTERVAAVAVESPSDNIEAPREIVELPTEVVVDTPEARGFTAKLQKVAFELRNGFYDYTGIDIPDQPVVNFVKQLPVYIGTKLLGWAQSAIGILIGLAIMVIGLYYFLADGPVMIRTVMHLSPLDANYEKELLERFGDVSRAVVVATLLSALVQGALAGVGYAVALPKESPIFLLTALTMVTAMVPFVGAAAVWVCVCGWVYLYGPHMVDGKLVEGDPLTAIILAIYCTIVVSGIDNVIKPLILHGQSKLHPLLALLSILGGVQVLGPVGILVGPMLVSFLQALLNMLRRELDILGGVNPKQLVTIDATPLTGIDAPAAETGSDSASSSSNGTSDKAAKSSAAKSAPNSRRKRDR